MRYATTILAIASIVSMGAAQLYSSYTPKIKGVPFLLIERVEQLDNLDQGDMFGKNRADFFALVTVNGVTTKTKVFVADDGRPYWEIPLDYTTRYSHVTVRLMDDDNGFERKDDHADINPRGGMKDLKFVFDRHTGRITGDVTAKTNEIVTMTGGGDDDNARIQLGVVKVA